MTDEYAVRDNPTKHRYEILRNGDVVGMITYRAAPGVKVLLHTEVEPAEEGHGVGNLLVSGALDDIRARGLRVDPLCPFVAAYLRRHPEQRDLIVRDHTRPE